MFAYHWLQKDDTDQWDRLGHQLGTMWSRSELLRMSTAEPGAREGADRIFVPLSLVINPDLVDGLLKKAKKDQNQPSATGDGTPLPPGDGLNTGMALPAGEEVVNMADLPKNEFLNVIRSGGLPTESAKREK
jgi:hypothetical protein